MAWRVIFVVVIGKFRVENVKISGGETFLLGVNV